MIKVLFVIGMFFLSYLSFCQSTGSTSSKQLIQDTTDDGKVFYRAEKMPEFTEGTHALEDTLMKKLSDYKSDFNGQIIKCVLTVTKGGSLKKIQNSWTGGNFSFEAPLIKALQSTSGLWKPAKQNGHLITAVKGLLIAFNEETLTIREIQF